MVDHSKQVYYGAMFRGGLIKARVFRYDRTGRYHKLMWESEKHYNTEGQAEAAALEYCEKNGYDDAVPGE